MERDLVEFAQLFQRFMQQMSDTAWSLGGSPLKELLDRHLGTDCSTLPVIADSFPSYDHANLQVALSAFLAAEGRRHELIGLSGQQRHYGSLSDLVEMGHHQIWVRLGSADYVNLPIGPDETLACVQFGLLLLEDRGARAVVLMRGPDEHGPHQAVSLEILCVDHGTARSLLAEVHRLMVELNVFRGQVLSFGQSRMGFVGAGPVNFHRRPQVSREDLVLPAGALEAIEREVCAVAAYSERLRRSGQHVKRGLLLYGPPGNGKTLTVRYLISRLSGHTVVLLTGGGLQMIGPACGLARMLQPSVVVLEDVDLVAEERTMNPFGNPVLFDLLNEMDGMAEDADVAFLLTTNRVDLLEPALAARPGRVDLAVEIGPPDEEAQRRLIELFGRGLTLRLGDVDTIVARTRGVAASFVKELVRKAAVIAADRADGSGGAGADGSGRLTVTDADVNAALDELLTETGALTHALLGGGTPGREPARGAPPSLR